MDVKNAGVASAEGDPNQHDQAELETLIKHI